MLYEGLRPLDFGLWSLLAKEKAMAKTEGQRPKTKKLTLYLKSNSPDNTGLFANKIG
jgi:hypothetical protein